MLSITEVIGILNRILEEKEPLKSELIKDIQNKIWNDESIKDGDLNEMLTELAYDLDFYQPNEEWRKDDNSYYGSERLEEVVKLALKRIKSDASR